MMKSIAFFLGVFTVGLLALLIVSGDLRRWLSGEPPSGAPEAPLATVGKTGGEDGKAAKDDPNVIRVQIWDPLKGRLDYTIQGHLDDQALSNLQDIEDIDSVTLRDGQLEVPIYEDVARDLPAPDDPARPRQFVLTFARAEYKASFRNAGLPGISTKERVRETVRLLGGGERGLGKLDDGSTFRFEELIFEIDRKQGLENPFTIHSTKPVSIQNGYLRLESPAGLDGVVRNKGLQKLTFFPPVRTYLDPRSARLFGLGGEGGSRGGLPPSGAAAAEPPAAKVAITCEGPLTFFLDLEPPSIRFEKEIFIYPLQGPEPSPGAPPPAPGPTRFHCQLLVIEVDSQARPPTPSRAVATWEGGRVQAHHQGKVMEGDRLVWTLPPRSPSTAEAAGAGAKDSRKARKADAGEVSRGEAVLTGKPRLTGDEGWLETGEIRFKLDEDRVFLKEGLKGAFRTDLVRAPEGGSPKSPATKKKEAAPKVGGRKAEAGSSDPTLPPTELPGPPSDAAAKERGAAPPEKLPERWEYVADEGEIVFAPGGAGPRGERGANPAGLKNVERMVARSSKDGGLVIKSEGDGRFRLAGRVLTYDAPARTVTIAGSEGADPRFQHDRVQGSARSIQLRTEEGLVSLDGGVAVKIEDLEGLAHGGAPASPEGPEGISGPVELLADTSSLRFDSSQRLLGAEARGKAEEHGPGIPAVLQSLSPRAGYRLTGHRLSWDQVEQVAAVQGVPGSPGCQAPELLYDGGRLLAESIRFDRKAWRVNLVGRVAIDQCEEVGLGAGSDPAARPSRRTGKDDGFELSAARAEVDLNENLRSNEKADCGSSKELRKVKRIHAFAAPDEAILIRSRLFRGRAQEATWDSEARELRFFGPGRQEVVLYDAGRESTITAREIVYHCAAQKVVFSGEVQGELRVNSSEGKGTESPGGESPGEKVPGAASPGEASLSPAASKTAGEGEAGEVLTFHYETSRLELTVVETENGLQPSTARALEKVLLRNERYGIQLDGDDLHYDHARREVRIFSENGRYQKLIHTHPAAEGPEAKAGGDPLPAKVDQIESREIRLTYHLVPATPGRNSSPSLDHLVVKFKDDVTATFFLPMKDGTPPGAEVGGPREEWKMQSDHLGIKLVPTEDRVRTVQLALAEGSVIFRSGDYMAIAQEALYEESLRDGQSLKKLRLRGDGQKPARLFNNSRTPPIAQAAAELSIMKRGESNPVWVEQKQLEKPLREPAGLEELRREPKAR